VGTWLHAFHVRCICHVINNAFEDALLLSPLLFAANKRLHSISNTLRNVAVRKELKLTCPRMIEMRWIFCVRMVEWLLSHTSAVYSHLSKEDQAILPMLPQLSQLLRPLFDLTGRCEGDKVTMAENFPLLSQIFLHYDDVHDSNLLFQKGVWAETLHIVSGCLWWRILHCGSLGQWVLSYALTPIGRASLLHSALPFLPHHMAFNPYVFNRYPKLPLVRKTVQRWRYDDPAVFPYVPGLEPDIVAVDERARRGGKGRGGRVRAGRDGEVKGRGSVQDPDSDTNTNHRKKRQEKGENATVPLYKLPYRVKVPLHDRYWEAEFEKEEEEEEGEGEKEESEGDDNEVGGSDGEDGDNEGDEEEDSEDVGDDGDDEYRDEEYVGSSTEGKKGWTKGKEKGVKVAKERTSKEEPEAEGKVKGEVEMEKEEETANKGENRGGKKKKETEQEKELRGLRIMWYFWEGEKNERGQGGRWRRLFYATDWRGLIMEEAERMCRRVYANYPGAWEEVRPQLQRWLTPLGLQNHPVLASDEALAYWYGVRGDHTPLGRFTNKFADLAVRLLTATASEAACERCLGHLKLIIGDRRRRLDKNTAFYLAVLSVPV
jgi:hypothetical protein